MEQNSPAVGAPVEPTVRPALVERLRRNADRWLPTSDHTLEAHNLLEEAAAEIERLNAWAVEYYKLSRTAVLFERERCARICDNLDAMSRDPMVCRGSAQECAEAIRAA
jgi:hypothetical protein